MQHNNDRWADGSPADDPTVSMERTAVGRWSAPTAPAPRREATRTWSEPVAAPEVAPPPTGGDNVAAPTGAPMSGDDGRWVPDPTAQLSVNGSEPVVDPSPVADGSDNEWSNVGYAADLGGQPTAWDTQPPSPPPIPAADLGSNGNGMVNGNGLEGMASTGADFFDQPVYGDSSDYGNGYPGPDSTMSTGGHDTLGDPYSGVAANPYLDQPANAYEPTGPNPYASDYPSNGGFGDEYDSADPIDAIDNAGRNFDEEELETGMAARRNAIEWAVVLVAAVLLALVLRAVLLQAFYIPSPSMEDTLLVDDRVLVNKLSYRLNDISRGDIVVFHRTEAEIAASGPGDPKDVIKRVIATEGERIEIRDNQVLINDQLLVEPYLDPNVSMADFGPQVVPEGHIFVMGDNRNLSSDSRGETGPVTEDRVVGRAFFLFWPLNRLSAL